MGGTAGKLYKAIKNPVRVTATDIFVEGKRKEKRKRKKRKRIKREGVLWDAASAPIQTRASRGRWSLEGKSHLCFRTTPKNSMTRLQATTRTRYRIRT